MDDFFLKYGLPGAVIASLSIFVVKLIEWHRKDRQDWQDQSKREREDNQKQVERLFDRQAELTDESNRVTRDNTNILSALKSLLENQNRK